MRCPYCRDRAAEQLRSEINRITTTMVRMAQASRGIKVEGRQPSIPTDNFERLIADLRRAV